MRNLTIRRRKSPIACGVKDQVYIRDETACELMIAGVPCRKLGTMKNGTVNTFQIGDGQSQIFVISGKLGRNGNHVAITLPEGQEDITLSGEHRYNVWNNIFAFDSHPYEENKQQQRKHLRKQRNTCFIILAVALAVLIISRNMESWMKGGPSPKTFTEGQFSITLTDGFEAEEQEGFYACYSTNSAAVFVVREDISFFGDMTVDEYAEYVLMANGREDLPLTKKGDQIHFSYTAEYDGKTYYYLAVLCKGGGAYWIVNFAALEMAQNVIQEDFPVWAASIQID